MKNRAETGNGEIPLNKTLLDEASKLKEERRILKERLAKIEQERTQVTPGVYQKVHADYAERLQKVTDRLMEKKQDIDRELATLYSTRDKIQANLKNHKETLEELQFRQKLGEFSKEDFHTKAKEQEDKITRFERVFSGVQANIKRYEEIFSGEEELLGEGPLSAAEGIDEWEQEAKESIAKEAPALGTQEASEWMEATKPNLEMRPQITILAGNENVGKSFPINGTVSIGRSHSNQVILKDSKVSRQHAEIKVRGSECILIDLNSSNGTLVNGQKIHEHLLTPNDEIQIGDFVLQYQQ